MHYEVSIRTKLISYFLFIVLVSTVTSAAFVVSHILIVNKYQQVQNNIFLQHQLIEATSALVTDYNVYRSTADAADLATYDADKRNIQSILASLDEGIVQKDSRALLEGIEKTLASILDETDNGVASIQAGDLADTSVRYSEAYRKFSFAQENITNLILKEVGYGQELGVQIEKTNQSILIFGGLLFVSTIVFLVLLSLFLSANFVAPLTRLTLLAKLIADGDLEKNVDQDLMTRGDEFGSLATSFSIMVGSLQKGMATLTQSSTFIENKNKELEKLNKFMVDRELKMIELKKKIKELEGDIEKRD